MIPAHDIEGIREFMKRNNPNWMAYTIEFNNQKLIAVRFPLSKKEEVCLNQFLKDKK